MKTSSACAIIDAAAVYGASRWIHGIKSVGASDDRLLFLEFLHDVLLYDKIIMDKSSASEALPANILKLFARVNSSAGEVIIDTEFLAPYKANESQTIAAATCRLIAGVCREEQIERRIKQLKTPWAYNSTVHHDYDLMRDALLQSNLDNQFLPFALFTYRGLCYSGFAKSYSDRQAAPMVYLASPGRISALQQILNSKDIQRLEFAQKAYSDLVSILDLPPTGYNFNHIAAVSAAEVSQLAIAVTSRAPDAAIELTLGLRASPSGRLLRQRWAERIWAHTKAVSLGFSSAEQRIENVAANGDVIQIIVGCAA